MALFTSIDLLHKKQQQTRLSMISVLSLRECRSWYEDKKNILYQSISDFPYLKKQRAVPCWLSTKVDIEWYHLNVNDLVLLSVESNCGYTEYSGFKGLLNRTLCLSAVLNILCMCVVYRCSVLADSQPVLLDLFLGWPYIY